MRNGSGRKRAVMLVTLFAFMSAVASAGASPSSPEFKFEGSGAISEVSKAGQQISFYHEGSPEIECKKVSFHEGRLIANSKEGTIKSLRLEECKDNSSAKCVITPILSKELKITLGGTSKAVTERFTPTEGTEIAKYEVKNKGEESCAIVGSYRLTGTLTSLAQNDEVSEAEHVSSFAIRGGEVKLREQAIFFSGQIGLALTSGNAWAIQ